MKSIGRLFTIVMSLPAVRTLVEDASRMHSVGGTVLTFMISIPIIRHKWRVMIIPTQTLLSVLDPLGDWLGLWTKKGLLIALLTFPTVSILLYRVE